ncbi:jacalin-related lectin 3-like [Zingiber officinale]|uniref:jacalin-related lectin 3-like n=1 Tax=Zingiber officinale TaxID=94328 RepID=UPI001C4B8AC1|nr:jacalin-related lectin 3-like [Zingiber officinale]
MTIVDSLEISYVVHGNEVKTHRIGGSGGQSHEFKLLPVEYINSVVGSVKTFRGETCIAKLEFKTNLGKKYGPLGKGGGIEFTVPVVEGQIVGFFGQSGSFLNGIGVYLAPN